MRAVGWVVLSRYEVERSVLGNPRIRFLRIRENQGSLVELAVMSGGRPGSGGGLFNIISAVVLIVGVLAVGIAAVLLARTLAVAHSISTKAAVIATTGRGINTATDSVIQLNRTNQTAASILNSAKPLQGALAGIVGTADEINALAGSINGSAGSINGSATGVNSSAGTINTSAVAIETNAVHINNSAGTINGLAKDINSRAADILDIAQRVDTDARHINEALDYTIGIAHAIKGDSSDIVGQAYRARTTSSCIAENCSRSIRRPLMTASERLGEFR